MNGWYRHPPCFLSWQPWRPLCCSPFSCSPFQSISKSCTIQLQKRSQICHCLFSSTRPCPRLCLDHDLSSGCQLRPPCFQGGLPPVLEQPEEPPPNTGQSSALPCLKNLWSFPIRIKHRLCLPSLGTNTTPLCIHLTSSLVLLQPNRSALCCTLSLILPEGICLWFSSGMFCHSLFAWLVLVWVLSLS